MSPSSGSWLRPQRQTAHLVIISHSCCQRLLENVFSILRQPPGGRAETLNPNGSTER